jgi:hypothetical protein
MPTVEEVCCFEIQQRKKGSSDGRKRGLKSQQCNKKAGRGQVAAGRRQGSRNPK